MCSLYQENNVGITVAVRHLGESVKNVTQMYKGDAF